MENASQALLIAGGILLAILTITVFVYLVHNLSIMGNAQEAKMEVDRLVEWNMEWEAYNKRLLYGAELLTVINKSENNNIDNPNQTVQVKVFIGEAEIDKEKVEQNKTQIFSCTEVKYGENGKISSMKFQLTE